MRFPILQIDSDGVAWTTGDYRFTRSYTTAPNDVKANGSHTTYKSLKDKGITWDSETINFGASDITNKIEYENTTGWYGWEHYEDPRFESAEPNRGRTSTPINQTPITDCISYIRYEQNKQNFNITMDDSIKEAEWFSPENIKMLPLIKL